jgi:hypothetical protein
MGVFIGMTTRPTQRTMSLLKPKPLRRPYAQAQERRPDGSTADPRVVAETANMNVRSLFRDDDTIDIGVEFLPPTEINGEIGRAFMPTTCSAPWLPWRLAALVRSYLCDHHGAGPGSGGRVDGTGSDRASRGMPTPPTKVSSESRPLVTAARLRGSLPLGAPTVSL